MATIAFFAYLHRGNLNATLKLADDLKQGGHRVVYIGLQDSESYIRSNDFDYISVYPTYFPKGYYDEYTRLDGLPVGIERLKALRKTVAHFNRFFHHLVSGGDEEFLSILRRLQPDLFIFPVDDALTEWPALMAYAAGVKSIYISSALRPCEESGIPPIHTPIIPTRSPVSALRVSLAWKKDRCARFVLSKFLGFFGLNLDFDSFARQLAAKYKYRWKIHEGAYKTNTTIKLPELVPCPPEFDFPGAEIPGRYYVEPSIHLRRSQPEFPWARLDPKRPLIYCALGTLYWFQKNRYKHFFQTLLDASRVKTDRQWVLSIGDILSVEEFGIVPENVILVNQAPQLKLLERATVMITHGGMNTIKECIYWGVPMISFQLGAESPGNTARVVYHGLGIQGDLRRLDVDYLRDLIEAVERSAYIRSQMKIMQEKFRRMEEAKPGVNLVELILKS